MANTRTLANGAIYDMDRHRIVANPGGGRGAITKQNAAQMAEIRRQRKQEAIAKAANDAVLRDDWRVGYGEYAYVAAIADTAMVKATTPDDPKAIDAARFLLQETGLAEPRAAQPAVSQVADASARVILELVDRIIAYGEQAYDTDAIDATADALDVQPDDPIDGDGETGG